MEPESGYEGPRLEVILRDPEMNQEANFQLFIEAILEGKESL